MHKHIILAGLLLSQSVFGGEMSLLNNHLVITLPAGATRVQRTTGIIASSSSQDKETLIRCGRGHTKMEVFAEELEAMASPDYPSSELRAMRELNTYGQFFEFGQLPGDIIYALLKEVPHPLEESNLYAVANIRHTDGTQQRLRFYFGYESAQNAQACRDAVIAALYTLRPGPGGGLNAQARTELISHGMKADKLALPLPAGYLSEHDNMESEPLHNYRPLVWAGKEAPTMGIKISTDPHMFCQNELHVTRSTASLRKGVLLGQPIEWYTYLQEGTGNYAAECLLPLGQKGRAVTFQAVEGSTCLYLHINILAPERKSMIDMIELAETMYFNTPEAAAAARAAWEKRYGSSSAATDKPSTGTSTSGSSSSTSTSGSTKSSSGTSTSTSSTTTSTSASSTTTATSTSSSSSSSSSSRSSGSTTSTGTTPASATTEAEG